MGFIEEEERKFREKIERQSAEEDIRIKKRLADLKSEQERIENEQKNLFKLWDEAEKQFLDSGLGTMLERLRKTDTIKKVFPLLRNFHNMRAYSEDERKQIDGRYHAQVTVYSESVDCPYPKYVLTIKFFNIITDSSGLITFEFGNILKHSRKIEKSAWNGDSRLLEEALGKACKSPFVRKIKGESYNAPEDGSFCLPSYSLISVLDGATQVKNLKKGDSVWTTDEFGNKLKAVIIQKTKKPVSENHKMAHIVLEDGRKLIVSPGHPTIGYKDLGSMKKGQTLDKSQITSVQIIPYEEKYTYDILLSGDTGAYWANDILIGSTLSDKFKQIQQNKITSRAVQI